MTERPTSVDRIAVREISQEAFNARFFQVAEEHLGKKFLVVSSFQNYDNFRGAVYLGVTRKTSDMIAITMNGVAPYKDLYPSSGEIGISLCWGEADLADDEDQNDPFMNLGPIFDLSSITGEVLLAGEKLFVDDKGEHGESNNILFGLEAIQEYVATNPKFQKVVDRLNRRVDHLINSGF